MGPAGPRTGRGAGLFILGGNQYFVACYDTFIGNYGRGAGIEAGGRKRAGSCPPCFDSPALPSSAALRVTPVPIPSVSLCSTSPLDKGSRPPDRGNRPSPRGRQGDHHPGSTDRKPRRGNWTAPAAIFANPGPSGPAGIQTGHSNFARRKYCIIFQ